MSNSILFIDGENFINKFEEILKSKNKKIDLSSIDFNKLFESKLQKLNVKRKIFYAAKLHFHPRTAKKSNELIRLQRKLRNTLVNQGFEFLISGHVRGQKIGQQIVFREKGVDVKIAVDLVSLSCDKKLNIAIICSSDSDLQPAIQELRKRKVKVIYLGFEINPNRGLMVTTDKTILFKNSEVVSALNT